MMRIALFACILAFGACSNAKPVPEEGEGDGELVPAFLQVAEENFGPAFMTVFNPDSSYVLLQRQPQNSPFVSGLFLVYDMTEERIVLAEQIAQGQIKWIRPYELEVVNIPGIVRGGAESAKPTGYRFHVKRARKMPLGK